MKTTAFIIELSTSPKTDFGKKDFAEQSLEQKVFTAVFGSSGSIFMDGLALYFANSDGESAHFAPKAYRAIGALKSADIIEKASHILSPSPIPEDSNARQALVAALSETAHAHLENLGQEFYTTQEIIDDLLFDYVKTHSSTFGPTPEDIQKQGE